MKEFTVLISDEHGIHARPAGEIVGCAKKFKSIITVKRESADGGGKSADCKRLLAVMGLAAKHGERLHFTVSGEDEDAAATELYGRCVDSGIADKGSALN